MKTRELEYFSTRVSQIFCYTCYPVDNQLLKRQFENTVLEQSDYFGDVFLICIRINPISGAQSPMNVR